MQIKIFSSESGGEFKMMEIEVNKWLKENEHSIIVHSISHSVSRSGNDNYHHIANVIILAYENST